MSNTKKNKKKPQKKTHVSPPAAKASPTSVSKAKKPAPPKQRNALVSRKILYAVMAILLVLSGGIALFGPKDNSTAQNTQGNTPVAGESTNQTIQTPAAVSKKQYSEAPKMTIDQNKKYVATLETDKGTIKLELFAKDAPKTVNSFVFLANDSFYDGTTFHRVLRSPAPFMAQGGDPTGTGSGGPGYKFEDEINSRKHITGTLSMANSGPNTNGSQFFITYAPQPHLDGRHTVFGQVIEGMDVLQKLNERDPSLNPPYPGEQIKSIRVQEAG